MKTPPIENLCCEYRWADAIVPSRSRTHLSFFARHWLPRSMDKSSAPTTARALGIAYEDWPWPLPSHADTRLLRLRAPGGLYPRCGSPRRLLQPGALQPAQQSTHRFKIRTLGSCGKSGAALDCDRVERSEERRGG